MGDAPATDAELRNFLELCRPREGKQLRAIVDSGSSSLSPKQRKAIADMTRDLHIDYRAAVLTQSLVVRGIVTALSWLGATQAAFAPEDLTAACAYLELTPEEIALVRDALPRARSEAAVSARAS
ncbi:MAG TPA: hypothetical protein VMF89_28075 [Polyangiales bacterium]|nr:hypothetical protein [Polyangiales bacterium]